MRTFALLMLIVFLVCVGLMVDAWDDMSIRRPDGVGAPAGRVEDYVWV